MMGPSIFGREQTRALRIDSKLSLGNWAGPSVPCRVPYGSHAGSD
eukprot:CAMPEP_0183389866 /NCGR_PEP_ID=MMETSP0370-20130417/5213_1 /TAXON_ID=268820 /ORGANISM="Peridinium aciculiferum, Strain PAER-2" /LENGTH=44 /DNA_ID= /DNA_START= /DNA_END= /DNA_ORIENTATION=